MCLAVPGRIESVVDDDPLMRSAKVNFGGVVKVVNISCVPEAIVGNYVIVHAGMALSCIDEAEAAKVFDSLRLIEGGQTGQ